MFRCTFDLNGDATKSECSVAATGLVGANGITTNKDRSLVLVNETPGAKLSVYRRSPDGTLSLIARQDLPHASDNIEYDHDREWVLFIHTFSAHSHTHTHTYRKNLCLIIQLLKMLCIGKQHLYIWHNSSIVDCCKDDGWRHNNNCPWRVA